MIGVKALLRLLAFGPVTDAEYFDKHPDKHLRLKAGGRLVVNPTHMEYLVRHGHCWCKK